MMTFCMALQRVLYRIRDLTMILDEAAVKPREDSKSGKQSFSNHETILSESENLYANSDLKSNILSLKELLRIRNSWRR